MPIFSVPIKVHGQFIGIAADAPSVDFIQGLVTKSSQALYDGAAEVALFGQNQHLIAYSKNPLLITQPAASLLALNAAIEAARAGVLPWSRTRSGAWRAKTQNATGEIQRLIQQLQRGTQEAVDAMQINQEKASYSVQQSAQVSQSLDWIVEAVSVITPMNMQIASAVEQQAAVADEIQQNIANIDAVATAVAQGMDQASEASTRLNRLADHQRDLVCRLHTQ